MKNKICVRNKKLKSGPIKEGRTNKWIFDDGSVGRLSNGDNISIYCSKCDKENKLKLYPALLNKEYICISCRISGEGNPFFGKHHTQETKEKIILNKPCMKGANNHFFGKHHTQETKEKIILNKPCAKGANNSFFGKQHTQETKDNMSLIQKNIWKNASQEKMNKASQDFKNTQEAQKLESPEKYYNDKRRAGIISSQSQYNKHKMNKLEKYFNDVLLENNIFGFEYSVILNRMQFDFGNKRKKILIEIQGDYWHGNPLLFGDTEGKRSLVEHQIKKKIKDEKKKEFAISKGFTLLCIWEYEINNNIKEVIERVKKCLQNIS